ncbi:glycosyltransferase family 2 protein [Sphingobacterium griseoflavum]|uniref:Glycosyltransferase 2-like domain-containing protein n=1 Tax=Sphingobacterium griseoflavum TaxID=1474952 RepID=A0ABQ3HZW0_9SPHI|nr:glycosyltransferase [Sphingobacterium griseoflavum]GHE39740.1 hypothetical protein GCM10017764_23800 [Sphingobacterium griseoflavum]
MPAPLISIVVPCYNQSQYLDECLNSVLNQTYESWECIIVNDGSPDNTEDIAKLWLAKDARFSYIEKENGGLSSARNAGLESAKGNWIQFLDCDDILETNKLKTNSSYLKDGVDVIVSGYRYFESDEGPDKQRIYGRDMFLPEVCINSDDNVDLKFLFKNKNPFVISAPLYSKDVFKRVGKFNENLKSLEDWEFNIRCALDNCTFQHVGYGFKDKVLIRLHNNSMMRSKSNMEHNHKILVNALNDNPNYLKFFGRNNDFNPSVFSVKWFRNIFVLLTPPIFLLLFKRIWRR